MASEVDYSGHAGLFNAAAVSSLLQLALMDASDLRSLCKYYGSINGKGTTVIEVPVLDIDQAAAATNESADAANQDYTSTSQNITVARQSIVREVTDLHTMAGSALTEDVIAMDLFNSCAMRFTDMLTTLFTSLTSNTAAGTTATALSVDAIYDAKQRLQEAGVPSGEPVACVLHPVQLSQLEDSMRAESGNVDAVYPQSQDMMNRKGPGFAFSWRGIDFYSCDSVTNDGTDYTGAMFGYGAFGYADGLPDQVILAEGKVMALADGVWLEKMRQPRKGTIEYVGNYYVGVSEIQDAAGVRVISAV